MCGIVGYVGRRQAAPILIEGLGQLDPVRVAEGKVGVATELVLLLPRDEAVAAVLPHHHDGVGADPGAGAPGREQRAAAVHG